MSDTGYYRKKNDNIEYVNISIIDDDGDEFEMDTLREIVKKTVDDKQDKLEKIVDFGAAITGDHYRGSAFMLGWVISKILGAYETNNEIKLHVHSDVEELDASEIKEKTVDMLEEMLEKIKNGDLDVSDMPLNMSRLDDDYE